MYCDVDDTYCVESSSDSNTLKKEFDAVCSVDGGTALCNDAKEFRDIYTSEAPKCDVNSDDCNVIVSAEAKRRAWLMMVDYFGNIVMSKVKKDTEIHSIYAAIVQDSTLKEDKYIIAISPADGHPIGSRVKLSSIRWVSFQTRKLKVPYDHAEPVHIRSNTSAIDINKEIYLKKRTDHASQYRVKGSPLIITLVHKKAGENSQFSDKGKIRLALNTFDCVMTFG